MNKIAKKYSVFLSGNTPVDPTSYTEYNEVYDKQSSKFVGSFTSTINLPITLNKDIETYNFIINAHYDAKQEINNNLNSKEIQNNSELNLFTSNTKLEYNFYIKNFENNIKNLKINSLQIPNFYTVVEDLSDDGKYGRFQGTTFFENSGIFSILPLALKSTKTVFPSKLTINRKKVSLDKYIKKFSPYKELFPFYAEIKFPTQEKPRDNISDIFDKYDIYSYILNMLSVSNVLSSVNINNLTTTKKYKTLELNEQLLNQIINFKPNLGLEFLFEINSKLANKNRSMQGILNNSVEYSEVIAYHIRKFENNNKPTSTKDGVPMQEWYIPNVSETDIEIIDTQILYSNEYTYTIDPVVLTFSNTYNVTRSNLNPSTFLYSFTRTPKIKIFDFNRLGSLYSNTLLDSPPMEPEIDIIPFIGVPNKVRINLNTAVGKKTVKPITFNTNEASKNEILIKSQDRLINDNLLTFQSDDSSKVFEIYRLDFKPNSYLDFVGSSLTTLLTDNESAITHIDTLNQNKKYYYTARCFDVHGNISNPSVIYEVEIVNDNGLILPYINVIDINSKEEEGVYNKEIKRYLKLKPALRHSRASSSTINDLRLGLADVSVWDKKFKVRVTSKNTGRKMDIYLTFKYVKKEG